jgi:hypothetical protein
MKNGFAHVLHTPAHTLLARTIGTGSVWARASGPHEAGERLRSQGKGRVAASNPNDLRGDGGD